MSTMKRPRQPRKPSTGGPQRPAADEIWPGDEEILDEEPLAPPTIEPEMSDGRVPTGPEARFYEEDDEVPDDPWEEEEEEEEEDLEEGFDDEDAE